MSGIGGISLFDERRSGGVMLENIKAVIFDMDGTLIDSMWVWTAVDREYEKKYQLEATEDFYMHMEGMSYTEVAEHFRVSFELPMTIDEIKGEWLEMTRELFRNDVMLKKGAFSFLKYLKEQGIQTGIATSSDREIVELVLESRGIADYIDNIVTSCEVKAGKPEPDVYLAVAENLGVSPIECLVFEDVPQGVKAGKLAGMRVCCTEDESNVKQRNLLRELSDYYIRSFEDVLGHSYEKL